MKSQRKSMNQSATVERTKGRSHSLSKDDVLQGSFNMDGGGFDQEELEDDQIAHHVKKVKANGFSAETDDDSEDSSRGNRDNHSTDHTLALYLEQMGSIPLLKRHQELELATRLD
jgi:sigma-70-like protein